MIRRCAWHKGIIGIKRPLLDFSVTDGICDKCRKKLEEGGKNELDDTHMVRAGDSGSVRAVHTRQLQNDKSGEVVEIKLGQC